MIWLRRFALALAVVTANPLPARASARVTRGVRLLRAGKIDEAVAALQKDFAADPKSAGLATDLAFAEQLKGEPAEAERLFRRAIELDPHRWYAYANLAAMKAGAPLDANGADALLGLLNRGLALQKKTDDGIGRAGILIAMAEVERAAGHSGNARGRLADAKRATPTAPQLRRLAALSQALDADDAKSSEARAAEEWPEPLIAADQLARLSAAEKLLAKDPAAALREADALSALHRTWRGPRWLRARALIALEQLEAGAQELDALLRLSPAQAAAWRLLGETLAEHGGQFEAERADAALRHALALEPSWTELWELRGRLLFRADHLDEARRALEHAEAAQLALGEQPTGELKSLLEAVRAQPEKDRAHPLEPAPEPTPASRALLAEAEDLLGKGDRTDANDRLNRALADSPTLIDAAVQRWSLSGALPEETARALWSDQAALLRLAAACRAQALAQTILSTEGTQDPESAQPLDAGSAQAVIAVFDAGVAESAADAGPATPAPPRAIFEADAVQAMVRPWLERAASLGNSSALLELARIRARESDADGALEDLGAAVAIGLTPEGHASALELRSALLAKEKALADPRSQLSSLQLSAARPEDALAVLGGNCEHENEPAKLLAIASSYELLGDLRQALGCEKIALASAPRDFAVLTRFSQTAARAPIALLLPLASELSSAANAGAASAFLAQARLFANAGRTDEALAAVDRFLSADAPPGFIEPGIAEAKLLRARLEKARTQASEERRTRAVIAIAIASVLLLLFLSRSRRGFTVASALARDPSLFPSVARAVAELRHDALKHRASALSMLGTAPRAEIVRSLLGTRPASTLVSDIYSTLAKAAEARGLSLRALPREPIFGKIFLDLRTAEEQLQHAEGPRDERIHAASARMQMHGARLASLLKLGPRTRLEASVLAAWIASLEAELRAQNKPWSSPALELQGLELDFPIAAEPLSAIFANLLRNAQAAASRAPQAHVLIRVSADRDAAGRQVLELAVGDSSEEPISLEQIEARESGRGLSLVRDLVREWQGHLRVRSEQSPWKKSIAVCFPLQNG